MTVRGLSVDPGSAHVGMARWEDGRPVQAWTTSPDPAMDYLRAWLDGGGPMRLAYEGFRLRGGTMALRQAGSDLVVVQVIGVIRYLGRVAGVEPSEVMPGDRATVLTRWKASGAPRLRGTDHARSALHVGCCVWAPHSRAWTDAWLDGLEYRDPYG